VSGFSLYSRDLLKNTLANPELKKIVENNLVFANNHTPTHSNSPSWDIFGYNRLDKNVIGETPAVLGGKEEFAPEYLFSSY
jgi:hypothetical protein